MAGKSREAGPLVDALFLSLSHHAVTEITASISRKPYLLLMKTIPASLKYALSVPCPTCGVAREAPCTLYPGELCSVPHLERMFLASEAIVKDKIEVAVGSV
jgi:hypothetical protein